MYIFNSFLLLLAPALIENCYTKNTMFTIFPRNTLMNTGQDVHTQCTHTNTHSRVHGHRLYYQKYFTENARHYENMDQY